MPELDPFDARLTAAVHAFADRAVTGVDAVAMAERSVGRRRTGAFAWLSSPLPVPAGLLLTLILLLGLLAWSVGVGAPWDQRTSVAPAPVPTATPVPNPTPVPSTSGQGDQRVVGTATLVVTTQPTRTLSGDVTRERAGVATISAVMNDRRVTGTGTFTFSRDVYTNVAAEWGAFHLANDQGTWDGTCRGQSIDGGTAATLACWLVGGGTYDGYSYYLQLTWTLQSVGDLEGLIYPGSPPQP
jgi:hypothetical protein